jgi:teichuronic acid biosynthesis glycosyltransferase TuaC
MLRVLTLSTLFPNALQPTFGVFVERQTLGLARLPDVEVEVVAPIGMPPWPLSRLSSYRGGAALPHGEEWRGLRVHRPRFPIIPRFGARWNATSMAKAVLPLLTDVRKRFPFDVIDAEFFWPDGPAAMHLSRALGVPFSVMARGSDIQYWMKRPAVARQIRAAGNAAGGLLIASKALGRVMADHGLPANRMTPHYPGVDGAIFRLRDRSEEKAKLGIEGPLLVTVGALIPGKGQRDAIAAAERIPGATLLLAGEGPDRKSLEAMIRERGLGERVHLLGSRSPEDVATMLAAADVMVLPTRSEGLANVWVEALASGTPVVTSDVGGAREVIDRPEAGALVPPEPEAIAAAVRAILADPPEPAAVRAAADKFDPSAEIARLHDHLARIVAEHKLGRAAD